MENRLSVHMYSVILPIHPSTTNSGLEIELYSERPDYRCKKSTIQLIAECAEDEW